MFILYHNSEIKVYQKQFNIDFKHNCDYNALKK